jgi:hypothetical protein
MDEWAWEQLHPWLAVRAELPVGPLFCIIDGRTRGPPWSGAAVRAEFRRVAALAGVRRRFAPHQLRHAHALELAREGVPLNIIQRQLGHANLGTTSIYLQGIDPEEIITAVRTRRAPMMSASAGAAALIRSPAITSGSATALPLRSDRASASTPLGETILARPKQASDRRGARRSLVRKHSLACARLGLDHGRTFAPSGRSKDAPGLLPLRREEAAAPRYWPRDCGSTPAKVRKSVIRKVPFLLGRVGCQRWLVAR